MLSLLSGIKAYLYAAVGAVVLALSVTVYVQHIKIEAKNGAISALETRLTVSNQSIEDLLKTVKDVNDQISKKEKSDLTKQATIKANLQYIAKQDQSLEALEAKLKNRVSVTVCPVPKDLKDAWNAL